MTHHAIKTPADCAAHIQGEDPDTWDATSCSYWVQAMCEFPVIYTPAPMIAQGVYHHQPDGTPILIWTGGRNDDWMTLVALIHEFAHHVHRPVWSTIPTIHHEFAAEKWTAEFFRLFIPRYATAVEEDCKSRCREMCQEWYELDISVHPVPEAMAQWCGWMPPTSDADYFENIRKRYEDPVNDEEIDF